MSGKVLSNWKQTCDGKYRVTLAIGVSTKYVMFFKANKPAKHTEIGISRSDFQGAEQPPIFSISPPPQLCAASTASCTVHVWLTRCGSGCTATPLSLPPPSGKTGDEAHDECWAKSALPLTGSRCRVTLAYGQPSPRWLLERDSILHWQ